MNSFGNAGSFLVLPLDILFFCELEYVIVVIVAKHRINEFANFFYVIFRDCNCGRLT